MLLLQIRSSKSKVRKILYIYLILISQARKQRNFLVEYHQSEIENLGRAHEMEKSLIFWYFTLIMFCIAYLGYLFLILHTYYPFWYCTFTWFCIAHLFYSMFFCSLCFFVLFSIVHLSVQIASLFNQLG